MLREIFKDHKSEKSSLHPIKNLQYFKQRGLGTPMKETTVKSNTEYLSFNRWIDDKKIFLYLPNRQNFQRPLRGAFLTGLGLSI